MTLRFMSNLAVISLTVSVLGLGSSDAQAQTFLKNSDSKRIEIDGIRGEQSSKGTNNVPHSGKILFPGDHFSRAFPGDHFTPTQQRMLVSQGVTSLADFMATDAAVIGRIVGAPERSVISWQKDIKDRMR